MLEIIKEINDSQHELKKINDSKENAAKQKFYSRLNKNKVFINVWDFMCLTGGKT